MSKSIAGLLFLLLFGSSAFAGAADLSKPHILVAKPELRDEVYGASIVVVTPIGGDQHVGFIVNRATEVTLDALFPGDGAAKKVPSPVYLGGPFASDAIFALVQRRESPGGKAFEVIPGVYAALDEAAVDGVVRSEPEHAKFVAGLIVWQPGELETEVKKGAWYVLEPDAALAMREPTGLWEELVQQLHMRANAI